MPKLNELMPWSRPSRLSIGRGGDIGTTLVALQQEMNQLFENFFSGRPPSMTEWRQDSISAPAINIVENGDSFKMEAELSGLDPKDVDVEVANGFLTIKGERREEKKDEKENYLRHEISYGSFLRTVPLPAAADGDRAKAAFKNGILTVTVPKRPEALQKPKKIEVKAAA